MRKLRPFNGDGMFYFTMLMLVSTIVWLVSGAVYALRNPELTETQVWLHMVGG